MSGERLALKIWLQHQVQSGKVYPGELVSWGSYNRISHSKWLTAAEISHPAILEPRSLKSRYWQGHVPSEGARGVSVPCLFHILVASSIPWVEYYSARKKMKLCHL